jgi:PleD family two-component response regulator
VLDRLHVATPDGMSCSAGLTTWVEPESALELFNRADAALYAAKHGGGDRTVLLPAGTSERVVTTGVPAAQL